jgi:ATP-binding cassette, subfamily B, bacterial
MMAQGATIYKALVKLHKLIMLDRRDVTSVYFFAIVGGLVSLVLPLGIQAILNFVMAASLSTSVIILIAIVIGGVFFNGFVQIRQLQVIERIRQKIFTRYSLEFGHRIPEMSMHEMDNHYLPEVVNRFFDVVALAKSIEKVLVEIPTSLIQILLGLILLSFYHPVFIAFGALVVIVLVIILGATSSRGFETSMEASDYKYRTAGWLQEVARCAKTFKYSKGSYLHVKNTDEIVNNYLDRRTAHFKILNAQFWSLIAFKVIIVATMLIAGTWLLLNQQINIGQFIASDIVILLIMTSIEKLIGSMDSVYNSLTSIEKISKIVDSSTDKSGDLSFNTLNKFDIEFNNVGYVYPNGSEALKDINFTIPHHKIACVKGESGSGRTTILRMLTGSYNEFTGSISLNKIPIGNFKLDELRRNTGIMLVGQDIFKGTILENLTMGNQQISTSEVVYLSEKFGLSDFIATNKLGYDTPLNPTGKKLNNAIIQNIKLIRALLGKPCILLLEEPFQHLNDQKKQALINYLKHEANATSVIISNSKTLEQNADVVIELEEGELTKFKNNG